MQSPFSSQPLHHYLSRWCRRYFGLVNHVVGILVWAVAVAFWGWFIAPLFGVAQIGVAQAYGLILTLKALQAKVPNKGVEEASFGDQIARIMMLPPFIAGIFIGVGWVVSIWVRWIAFHRWGIL